MMIKLLLTLALLLSISFSHATENEAISFFTNKMVKDFKKGIDAYNAEKESSLPKIEDLGSTYTFMIKKNTIRFSIVNYLNDQLYVNDKLTIFPKVKNPKTTLLDLLFTPAFAEEDAEMPTLDVESTKILLTTLSTFRENLEKIGWLCMTDSCKKEMREENLWKISAELKKQKEICSKNLAETSESIKRYHRTDIHYAFSFLGSPEFKEVREFMKRITKTNKEAVAIFMKDHMGIENKSHYSCMEVMIPVGLYQMTKNAASDPEAEKTINVAKKNCIELEELKSCLVNFQADTKTINDKKRGVDAPVFEFPDVNSTFNKTVPK